MASELEVMCVRSPLPVTARIHRKRTGASTGTMYHTIKHSSLKHSLRCVHIMHLVCCVQASVCATSHLLYSYPAVLPRCTQHPLYATTEMHLLAKRSKVMKRGPRQKKKTEFFCELWVKPLTQPSASVLVNMGASSSIVGVRSSGVIGVSGDRPPGVWSGWTQGIEEGTQDLHPG